jgi:hypothetical protein
MMKVLNNNSSRLISTSKKLLIFLSSEFNPQAHKYDIEKTSMQMAEKVEDKNIHIPKWAHTKHSRTNGKHSINAMKLHRIKRYMEIK